MAASQTSSPALSTAPLVGARGWEWAAALALLVAGSIGVWQLPRAGVADWERHALTVVQAVRAQRVAMMREGAEPQPLLSWLQSESAPTPAKLPGALAQQKTMGARHWERQGRRFSLIAFEIDGAAVANLVATPRDGPGAELEKPSVSRTGDWTLARWTEPGLECLVITDAPESQITELLSAQPAAQ